MKNLTKNPRMLAICVAAILIVLVIIVVSVSNKGNNGPVDKASDSSDFVLLSEAVPDAICVPNRHDKQATRDCRCKSKRDQPFYAT